jgi:hypothetical protein
MKPEDIVISLDLAKKLKKLDVPQESLARWSLDGHLVWFEDAYKQLNGGWVSAFTATELSQFYPKEIWIHTSDTTMKHRQGFFQFIKIEDEYRAAFFVESANGDPPIELYRSEDHNEANARANLLIYLLEQKILEIPSI